MSTQSSGPDEKFMAVYQQLQRAASRLFAHERCDHTLQATAVVHEVFMKLRPSLNDIDAKDYYPVAAHYLRLYLVDYARQKRALKRGGDAQRATYVSSLIQPHDGTSHVDVEALHEALEELSRIHERAGKVVTLKFFAGLENQEIAVALQASEATIKRDWNFAKAWLHQYLAEHADVSV